MSLCLFNTYFLSNSLSSHNNLKKRVLQSLKAIFHCFRSDRLHTTSSTCFIISGQVGIYSDLVYTLLVKIKHYCHLTSNRLHRAVHE